MKKLLIMSLALVGTLALAGVASASTAETLQPARPAGGPASTITYSEEVIVNNTFKADSAYIGSTEAGVGGVTFFNGTIVNNSVDEDGASTIPVTFGDDVRIDGEIYRTEKGGDNPLKVTDTIMPTSNNTYSLGTSGNRFKDSYLSGSLTAASVTTSGAVTTGSIVTTGTVDGVDVSAIPSTYVSQSSPSWDSRTGYASISASNCISENDDGSNGYTFSSGGSQIYADDNGVSFFCSVQLPHGATVTSATAYVKDDGAGFMTATLYRSALTAYSSNNLGTRNTLTGATGDRTIVIDSINETVDNDSNSYYMEIYFSASGTDYNFRGAIINYTYTQPY